MDKKVFLQLSFVVFFCLFSRYMLSEKESANYMIIDSGFVPFYFPKEVDGQRSTLGETAIKPNAVHGIY